MLHRWFLVVIALAVAAVAAASEPPADPPPRILFVLTSHDRKGDQPSGYWLAEVTHPYQVMAARGWRVDLVSPKGGAAPLDPASLDLKDPINAAFWNDPARRRLVELTAKPADVDAKDYQAVFIAGGHGAMWDLPDDARIAAIIGSVYDRGGVVGAVCHGPAGLVNVRIADGTFLVAGKEVAAFTNEEERLAKLERVVPFLLADRLVERGARHQAAPAWQAKVVVSGRLVTGQNPASATGVGEAMAALLRPGSAP